MKSSLIRVAIAFCLIGFLCIAMFCFFSGYFKEIVVNDVLYNEEIFEISFDDIDENSYCVIVKNDSDLAQVKWHKIENDLCKYKVSAYGSYSVYVRKGKQISRVNVPDETFKIEPDKSVYYLAVGDSRKLLYKDISLGESAVSLKSKNADIVSVSDNEIFARKKGVTKVFMHGNGVKKEIVVVTDLINKMPKSYDYDRSYLSCDMFSLKEAQLLDKILFDRIKDVGIGTRAGVVAAARFLTLEFPYRISYFSENGRLGNYSGGLKVDGEGCYYHKGLYLADDKFGDIEYVDKGPNIWGCMIYSRPSKGMRANGLDFSGFTTWAVYNGGFDIEDLGAHGGNSLLYDLNDIGDEVKLTRDIALSDKIKAGDLLGEVSVSEGHSALIVGIDKDNYYVAESLWIDPLGLNVNTYKKSELSKYFETVNLMDNYYKKDGNYSAMWY